MNYQIPAKAIKNIIKKEFESFRNGALYGDSSGVNTIRYCNEATREIFDSGYEAALKRLEACNDHESLNDFVGDFYRMSLEDWINSL